MRSKVAKSQRACCATGAKTVSRKQALETRADNPLTALIIPLL
jgi:hypothetical protein